MHRQKNLFARVVAFDNLYHAFLGASHGKRDRPEVREFEYHLETRLWEIRRELVAGQVSWPTVRASVASWFGLANHANAFRLSASILANRDTRNLGKRLLVRRLERVAAVSSRGKSGYGLVRSGGDVTAPRS